MQKLTQSLNLKQKLSPQQIQFLGLLQIPIIDLDKRIETEIEENPVLEEDEESSEYNDNNNYSSKEKIKTDFIVNNTSSNNDSLSSFLHKQLIGTNLEKLQLDVVAYLIDSLDEDGFLRRDVESIISDFFISNEIEISTEKMLDSIKIVQSFDPIGVGAQNLQECLLLQIKRKKLDNKALITLILEKYYHEFTNKNFEKIIKELNISKNELSLVYGVVEKLNPIPGASFTKNKDFGEYIVADFKINNNEGILELILNKVNTKKLQVSSFYKNLLSETKDNETKKFLLEKIEKAKWFVDSLNKRDNTLSTVMQTIMAIQKKYFISGKESDLVPMKLADIAEKVNLDISTISRVTNSKYLETSFGTYLLKDLFSEAYRKDNGELISTKHIKTKLCDVIEREDKSYPYTDEKICQILGKEEYHIARRTVAKYREQLSIPIAKLRRTI
tara:strand:+ start:1651 stop:2982 length:1332 start_codon:yes stop_codon:yes gene_type:complete